MKADENILLEKARTLLDFALIKKLATALWRKDSSGHGAAIMLGAGFTRCAAQSGDISKAPPLWFDLSKRLAVDLDPLNENLPYSDPLRLAEEYRAHFGQQTMIDLLRGEINDGSWTPGELHKTVLSFPWTDVLTTNWDTLLERTAANLHTPIYNIVTKQSDISYFRAPRIVKLHGTIDVSENLIFTQEDYRKYPQTHAAFVNLSRQIFIENELCLLGFSGEDPNFLQWAGWVRDNLTENAHKIYLIGALKLTPAKRKYLESLNVAPIDLWDLVADYDDPNLRHYKATEAFLLMLTSLKPDDASNWRPTSLEKKSSTLQILQALKSDRESYPGWLVCPPIIRWEIQNQLSKFMVSQKYINDLPSEHKEALLYSICWQHSKTYELTPQWIVSELMKIWDPKTKCTLTTKQQLEIALLILKNSRWHTYDPIDGETVSETASNIILKNLKYCPENSNEVNYHYALIARDNFEYSKLESLIDDIDDSDPIWKIRKASLLAELGKFYDGEKLILSAFVELQDHHRKNRNSIYIFSRLAWANIMVSGVNRNYSDSADNTYLNFKKWECDPWNHLDDLSTRAGKDLEKYHQKEIEALFNPGSYKNNANTISFNNEIHILLLLDGITRETGLPISWNNTSFIKKTIENLTFSENLCTSEKFCLSIRASNYDKSKSIQHNFSRIKIACAQNKDIEDALNYCKESINYFRTTYPTTVNAESKTYHIEKLRVFIEILSRLLIRVTPEIAKSMFIMASEIGQEKWSTHPWIHEPLKNLLGNSLLSVPPNQHDELLLHCLKFPLYNEESHHFAPNPIIYKPGLRPNTSEHDQAISYLINCISTPPPPHTSKTNLETGTETPTNATTDINQLFKKHSINTSALSRLLPLVSSGFTTEIENNKISKALYGDNFDYTMLPNSNFFPHTFWTFPTDAPEKLHSLITDTLFTKEHTLDETYLKPIIYAALNKEKKFLPTSHQAVEIFEELVNWSPPSKQDFIAARKVDYIAGLIGQALAFSIAPALSTEDLTSTRYNQIKDLFNATNSSSIILAMVFFSKDNEIIETEVCKLIRRHLQSRSQENILYASLAALNLRKISSSTNAKGLISRLIHLVGSGRKTGLAYILNNLNDRYTENLLSDEDIDTLSDSLPAIYDDSRYDSIDHNSAEAIDASLIRSKCVKLAQKITTVKQDSYPSLIALINSSLHDELPEVRLSSLID